MTVFKYFALGIAVLTFDGPSSAQEVEPVEPPAVDDDFADLFAAESAENQARIAENRAAIAENKTAIAENRAAIAENKTAIAENRAAIAEDKAAIAEDKAAIAEIETRIAEIETRIAENKAETERILQKAADKLAEEVPADPPAPQ